MAKKPHFFPIEPDVEYESIPEKIGVGIMTLHIAAGHLGRLLRQAVGGASPKGW